MRARFLWIVQREVSENRVRTRSRFTSEIPRHARVYAYLLTHACARAQVYWFIGREVVHTFTGRKMLCTRFLVESSRALFLLTVTGGSLYALVSYIRIYKGLYGCLLKGPNGTNSKRTRSALLLVPFPVECSSLENHRRTLVPAATAGSFRAAHSPLVFKRRHAGGRVRFS